MQKLIFVNVEVMQAQVADLMRVLNNRQDLVDATAQPVPRPSAPSKALFRFAVAATAYHM